VRAEGGYEYDEALDTAEVRHGARQDESGPLVRLHRLRSPSSG
jgi:hypothetical protein